MNTSTATSTAATSSTAPQVRGRRPDRGGDLRKPQAQLRVGAAGPEGRRAHQDRVRDGPVAAGQRHASRATSCGRPTPAGKLPAVLVIHENRGLNPYIEDVARRFAVANFIAFAPDGLTSVGGYPGDDEEGAVKFRKVDGPKMIEDFVASAGWLKARAESNGQARRGRLLLRRRHRQPARGAAGPGSRRGRAVLRPPGRAPRMRPKIKAPLMLHYAGQRSGHQRRHGRPTKRRSRRTT